MAHTLAVVGVHLNVAADALDAAAPEEAGDALRLASWRWCGWWRPG